MRCPFCKKDNDRVIDSRTSDDGGSIRRRRECHECNRRFTSYERIEEIPFYVIKKNGTRQVFDRQRILSGLLKACEKRPVPTEKIEEVVERIETDIMNTHEKEVTSTDIGERVIDELRRLDQVAYVRFASVYRDFKDIDEFRNALEGLLK